MDFKNSAALNVLHKYRRSQNGELEGAATLVLSCSDGISCSDRWKQSSVAVSPHLPHTVKLDFHFLCEIQHMYVCVCFLIEVEWTDDVVLVPSGRQSSSVTHVYTFIFIFFSLWFLVGYGAHLPVLWGGPCGVSILHLLSPTSHSIPPPTPTPLRVTSLFSVSGNLLLFRSWFIYVIF